MLGKKNKKTVKGGNKLRKVSAGSGNERRMGIKGSATSAVTIKLSKLNSRFVHNSVTAVILVFLYLLFPERHRCFRCFFHLNLISIMIFLAF